jgi:hypothetical protein
VKDVKKMGDFQGRIKKIYGRCKINSIFGPNGGMS